MKGNLHINLLQSWVDYGSLREHFVRAARCSEVREKLGAGVRVEVEHMHVKKVAFAILYAPEYVQSILVRFEYHGMTCITTLAKSGPAQYLRTYRTCVSESAA